MMFGAAGMSGSMVVLAATSWGSQEPQNSKGAGIAAAVFLFVFNTFFAIGWLGYVSGLRHLMLQSPSY